MGLQITDAQQFPIALGGQDVKGNPAPITGPLSWGVSDQTILTVTPSADGLSATVAAAGALGSAQVNVSDAGDNGITGVFEVTVVGSGAVTLVLSAGTPVPIPTPAAPAAAAAGA